MVMNSVSSQTVKALETSGKKSIDGALKSESVQRLIESKGGKRGKPGVVSFWASGSLVLNVKHKDDLINLAKDDTLRNIVSDIYPNRHIETPSPPNVKSLPGEVSAMENEVSTWGLQKSNALAC